MGSHTMFTCLAIILGFALAEACSPVPVVTIPRGHNSSHDEVHENAGDREIRLLPAPNPQFMYLGSADKKDFYAAVNLPMDWETAFDHCLSSNMELASSILTESQRVFLSTAVVDVANALGLESPIRFWTSFSGLEKVEDACETTVLSRKNLTARSAKCSDLVELTICEKED